MCLLSSGSQVRVLPGALLPENGRPDEITTRRRRRWECRHSAQIH
jgi:hypothetical protein